MAWGDSIVSGDKSGAKQSKRVHLQRLLGLCSSGRPQRWDRVRLGAEQRLGAGKVRPVMSLERIFKVATWLLVKGSSGERGVGLRRASARIRSLEEVMGALTLVGNQETLIARASQIQTVEQR
jgi:hypothetical protein